MPRASKNGDSLTRRETKTAERQKHTVERKPISLRKDRKWTKFESRRRERGIQMNGNPVCGCIRSIGLLQPDEQKKKLPRSTWFDSDVIQSIVSAASGV